MRPDPMSDAFWLKVADEEIDRLRTALALLRGYVDMNGEGGRIIDEALSLAVDDPVGGRP